MPIEHCTIYFVNEKYIFILFFLTMTKQIITHRTFADEAHTSINQHLNTRENLQKVNTPEKDPKHCYATPRE